MVEGKKKEDGPQKSLSVNLPSPSTATVDSGVAVDGEETLLSESTKGFVDAEEGDEAEVVVLLEVVCESLTEAGVAPEAMHARSCSEVIGRRERAEERSERRLRKNLSPRTAPKTDRHAREHPRPLLHLRQPSPRCLYPFPSPCPPRPPLISIPLSLTSNSISDQPDALVKSFTPPSTPTRRFPNPLRPRQCLPLFSLNKWRFRRRPPSEAWQQLARINRRLPDSLRRVLRPCVDLLSANRLHLPTSSTLPFPSVTNFAPHSLV